MTPSESFNVLLVHPPAASPAGPPWASAHIAASLNLHGVSVDHYDANLDFFLNHLLDPKHLSNALDQIETRKHRGVFEAADRGVRDRLDLVMESPSDWRQAIGSAGSCLEILRSEDFYRPESAVSALREIEDLLALSSLAFYPSCTQWDRFENPSLRSWTDVERFTVDAAVNPFLSLCERGLAPRLARRRQDCLILTAAAPAQLLAALTLARFSKKRFPRLHVALVGRLPSLDGAELHADSLISGTGPRSILALIDRLGKRSVRVDPTETTEADFSGLPLKDYLAPSLILPYRAPCPSAAENFSPSRVLDNLAALAQILGAKGFLIEDPPFKASDMAEFSRVMTGEKTPFCLGITCSLNGIYLPGTMRSAHGSGLRLIRWQNPAGPLSEISRILWNASKAGIWNHVKFSQTQHGCFTQALTRFVNANPNIAHSWEHRQYASSPFSPPPQDIDQVARPYGQVAKLPGTPFWCILKDPVYLLLYLNRHGLKSVLRWRVGERGRSIRMLGENLEYHFVRPAELPPGDLAEICRMVEAGGSVATQWVRHNLERAFLIGYVREQGVIVANSSLKHPRAEYVERVNRLSGLDIRAYLERGYTSVRPEYRGLGIGTKLLEGLTARAGKRKLFSIITADNVGTQKIALRNKTKQVASFYSERLGKEVGVWVPEWMIEDGRNR